MSQDLVGTTVRVDGRCLSNLCRHQSFSSRQCKDIHSHRPVQEWCDGKSATLYFLSIYCILRHEGIEGEKLEFTQVLSPSEKFCYDTSKVIGFGIPSLPDKLFYCAHFRNSRNPLRLVIGCCKDIRLDPQVFVLWCEEGPHLSVSRIGEP